MFFGGECGGFMVIYFVLVNVCSNFKYWINIQVRCFVCIGGYVIGFEVEFFVGNGYVGIVKFILEIGCVVFVVGIFGSVKIFFCSKFRFESVILIVFCN